MLKSGVWIARIAYVVFFVPLFFTGVVAVFLECLAQVLGWLFITADDALRTRSGW